MALKTMAELNDVKQLETEFDQNTTPASIIRDDSDGTEYLCVACEAGYTGNGSHEGLVNLADLIDWLKHNRRELLDPAPKEKMSTNIVKVYCEVVDDSVGFMWRIVAECGALGKYTGEWNHLYQSFAELKAPSGAGGAIQHWIAGSSFYGGQNKTVGDLPEFTPFTIAETIGDGPQNVSRSD